MSKIIVFVDDSQTVLMSAELGVKDLEEQGVISTKYFLNPNELLKKVENGFVYDLCITDINMPQMSGFDLVSKLKTFSSVKAKPIIALTTENTADMKIKGKDVGLAGWLTKPFTDDKLLMAIKRILRIR